MTDVDGESEFVIDGHGSGARTSLFTVTGSVEIDKFSVHPNTYVETPLSPSTFTVTRSRTHLARAQAHSDSRYLLPTRITAYPNAVNSKGKKIALEDSVVVEAKKPGMTSFVELSVSAYTDDFGKFTAGYGPLPTGTKIRISVTDCGWCSDTQSVVTLR